MKRTLTIHFEKAVTSPKLETLEVVVTPLNSANHPENDQTILGLKQTRKVTLVDPVTTVSFELTPTYQVGLDRPILYRIAWRRGSFGPVESHEFAMPDQNVDFDDLFNLGQIITGENYLTYDDLGVPGRAAQLNDDGQVIDANGNIIISGDTADLKVRLDNEIMQRRSADNTLRSDLLNEISTGLTNLNTARQNALSSAVSQLQALISGESATRSTEDTAIRTSIAGVQTSLTTTANTLRGEFASADAALDARKADLVNGKIPANQIPDIALGTTVVVADQAEMLQLTSAQVQPGDLAVRPDGTFMLVSPVIGDPGSWRKITAGAAVSSVNGQTGAVVLSYNEVGARPASAPIPMVDILGLDSALLNKANTSALNSLSSTVGAESTRLTTLTTRVDGMQGAWSQAVADAHGHANAASASAGQAAQSAQGISQTEQSVLGIKNDITTLKSEVVQTVAQVEGVAEDIEGDVDMIGDYSSIVNIGAAIVNSLLDESSQQLDFVQQEVTRVETLSTASDEDFAALLDNDTETRRALDERYTGGVRFVEDPPGSGLYSIVPLSL